MKAFMQSYFRNEMPYFVQIIGESVQGSEIILQLIFQMSIVAQILSRSSKVHGHVSTHLNSLIVFYSCYIFETNTYKKNDSLT